MAVASSQQVALFQGENLTVLSRERNMGPVDWGSQMMDIP